MTDAADSLKPEARKREAPAEGGPFNEVEDVILKRRSVRYYKKKEAPEYLVKRILEAGRYAPSAGNAQPWKFIVVRDPKMIQEMTDDVVNVCKKLMKFADYIKPGNERKQWRAKLLQKLFPNLFHPIPFGAMKLIAEGKLGVWHGASTVIVMLVDMRSPGKPLVDVGIAGQNMVLAAHSMGLGTCWVSFITPLENMRKWKKQFGLRYPYKLVTSIGVGYPIGNPDGFVKRETQSVDWYDEDGNLREVF